MKGEKEGRGWLLESIDIFFNEVLNCFLLSIEHILGTLKIFYIINLILRFFTNPVFWLVENAVMFLTMPAKKFIVNFPGSTGLYPFFIALFPWLWRHFAAIPIGLRVISFLCPICASEDTMNLSCDLVD